MEIEPKYDNDQIITLLDNYFRASPRPMPWPEIRREMKTEATVNALERLLWGVVTGYGGGHADAPRRDEPEWPQGLEHARTGYVWHEREVRVLRSALGGEGQQRDPVVDIAYIATTLARTELEVVEKWDQLNKDALGREGFFSS